MVEVHCRHTFVRIAWKNFADIVRFAKKVIEIVLWFVYNDCNVAQATEL